VVENSFQFTLLFSSYVWLCRFLQPSSSSVQMEYTGTPKTPMTTTMATLVQPAPPPGVAQLVAELAAVKELTK